METGGGLDVRSQRALLLRAARYCPPPPRRADLPDDTCPHLPLAFSVVLHDATAEAELEAEAYMGSVGVRGRQYSDVILPLSDFTGVDLSAVTAIELRFSSPGTDAGDLWIDDVRFE